MLLRFWLCEPAKKMIKVGGSIHFIWFGMLFTVQRPCLQLQVSAEQLNRQNTEHCKLNVHEYGIVKFGYSEMPSN